MTLRAKVAAISAAKNPIPVTRGRLAEDYDGIGEFVAVSMSRGSTSAALAKVAPGAATTGQSIPAGTQVSVISQHGHLEVVSMGSKVATGYTLAPGETNELEATIEPVNLTTPTVNDETGRTILSAQGLGAQAGLQSNGMIPNGDFTWDLTDILALEDGENESLPYWKITNNGMAEAFKTNKFILYRADSLADELVLTSDPFPAVLDEMYLRLDFGVLSTIDAGGIWQITTRVIYLDENLVPIAYSPEYYPGLMVETGFTATYAASVPPVVAPSVDLNSEFSSTPFKSAYSIYTDPLAVPGYGRAAYFQVELAIKQTGTLDSTHYGVLSGIYLVPAIQQSGIVSLPKFKADHDTVNISSSSYGEVDVTFAEPFSSAPIVVATISTTTSLYFCAVNSVTATGFTIRVIHRDGSTVTASLNVNWIAILI